MFFINLDKIYDSISIPQNANRCGPDEKASHIPSVQSMFQKLLVAEARFDQARYAISGEGEREEINGTCSSVRRAHEDFHRQILDSEITLMNDTRERTVSRIARLRAVFLIP